MTQKYAARVIRVTDGDTIQAEVFTTFVETKLSQTLNIRFNKIDALETSGRERTLGLKAKDWLKNEILGKEIEIELIEKDFYKRWLATVYLDGINLNEEMLKLGLVEIYSVENHNDGELDV